MRMNLLGDEGWIEREKPSEKPGFQWRRMRIAGEHLGASLYELPPGEKTFPYHYELGNDELLVVVTGRPTLRDPDGERELEPGDCILFPSGPAGAHQIINRTNEPTLPRGAVQIDSGAKFDTRQRRSSGSGLRRIMFRRDDAVDYWEGEEQSE